MVERVFEASGADPEGIAARITQALKDRQEILEAYLFGSVARGEATDHSDIDIAVYVDPSHPDEGWGYDAELTADLMAAMNTSKIDVVILNRAPPVLYHRVLTEGHRLLSRDLPATTRRAGQALSRYFDFSIQLRKYEAARKGQSEGDAFKP